MDYHDSSISDLLEFGFPVDYSSSVLPHVLEYRNHRGALSHADEVTDYLKKECVKGRMAGPFDCIPLDSLMVSPLNTVPKADSDERRVLVDLSWPPGSSVNDGIIKGFYLGQSFTLNFPTVDNICALLVQVGPGAHIYKRDLAQAYRQFPVDPKDFNLLGYFWQGQYYVDSVLAMGQRSSALCCQRATGAVIHIHNSKGFPSLVYLDDFFGVSPPDVSAVAFKALGDLFTYLGLSEKQSKAVPPTTCATVLGILFDTNAMTMSVTPARLEEITSLLSIWLDKKKASKREIQQLLGKLSFVSKCVRQSRIFLNRLFAALRSLRRDHHRIDLSSDFRKDLIWWMTFVKVYNGVSVIPPNLFSNEITFCI